MKISRYFTTKKSGPYDGIEFRTTTSEIRNPDGTIVFSHKSIEVPADWSQVACDVLAQKYFRATPVDQFGVTEPLPSRSTTIPWKYILNM